MSKILKSLLLLFFAAFSANAQNLETLNITIISEMDGPAGLLTQFENQTKTEINSLMLNRRTVVYDSKKCKCEPTELHNLFAAAFADNNVDLVIAIGTQPSAVLSQQKNFSKPAIASLIIDHELQNVPMTNAGTSGINNFAYVQSPFSFKKDLELLHSIYQFKNIGIIAENDADNFFPKINELFKNAVKELDAGITILPASTNINSISSDVDAVYVLPLTKTFSNEDYPTLFANLADKKLPSVALMGEIMVKQGALVGYESEPNLNKLPRRIALNVSKIITDGINPSDLPVSIVTYSDNVVINMNTARKTGIYPDWDLASEATLLNAIDDNTDRSLSLKTTIMEALDRNLSLKVAQVDPKLAQTEVALAQSEYLPQLGVNTSLALLDENTANNSFGTKGRLNWLASSSLSQLVYSEPALANIAIQKLLTKGAESGLEATQMDVVLEAAQSYLAVLQARAFMDIQASNVAVTKDNLDISKAKDEVGYSGATDLNRWTTELALDKIDLNDAQAQLQQAKYNLNQILNQNISEAFLAEDISAEDNFLMANGGRLMYSIKNEAELNKLADFLVEEAMNNLPTLREINYGLQSQERLLKSRERAFFMPTAGVSGNWDYTLKRWDVSPNVLTGTVPDVEPGWNVGLGVAFPILQGGQRNINKQQAKLNIMQTEGQLADAENQFELRVRATLQEVSASGYSVQQFKVATKAATENFNIVQDAYSQGLANVTTLIDAQNAKIQTEIGAANAGYQFLLDVIELERSIGFYYNLATPQERSGFMDRMAQYMASK
jgi:outer membrane protein TolC